MCSDCQPMVDEEIRKKDFMAQTRALGVSAQRSRQLQMGRQMSAQYSFRDVWIWRIRGLLWLATLIYSIWLDISGKLSYLRGILLLTRL